MLVASGGHRCKACKRALLEPLVNLVDGALVESELPEFQLHLVTGHALEFQVVDVAQVVDESGFECRVECLGVAVLHGRMCACELALEHLLRFALADECRVAAMLAVAADEADRHEVERDGCGKENPENDVPVRSRGFSVALDGVDKADVAAERFDFLLLHGGGAGGMFPGSSP